MVRSRTTSRQGSAAYGSGAVGRERSASLAVHRDQPQPTSKSVRATRCHQPRAPLARPGQGAASARTVGSGLWVVYGGVRHARSEGREGTAGGVGGITEFVIEHSWN